MATSKSALASRLTQRKEAIASGVESKSNTKPSRVIRLKSGKVVELTLYQFQGSKEIESNTDVDENNIRDQSQLTNESLQDILSSIEKVQLYPAIGYMESGKIKIVDGSRRRKASILKNCTFTVEVANSEVTQEDAQEIVRISEQKKKLSYIEWGRFYQAKLDAQLYKDAKSMAEAEEISAGRLSLCLNAAKIPSELLELFLDNSLIGSQKTTKVLIDVSKQIGEKGITYSEFSQSIESELLSAMESATSPEEHTELVLDIIEKAISRSKTKPVKSKKKPETIGTGVTYTLKSKDSAIINLRKVPEDKKRLILDYIRKIMN